MRILGKCTLLIALCALVCTDGITVSAVSSENASGEALPVCPNGLCPAGDAPAAQAAVPHVKEPVTVTEPAGGVSDSLQVQQRAAEGFQRLQARLQQARSAIEALQAAWLEQEALVLASLQSAGGRTAAPALLTPAREAEPRGPSTPRPSPPVSHQSHTAGGGGARPGRLDAPDAAAAFPGGAVPRAAERTLARGRKPWDMYFDLLAGVRTEGHVSALYMMAEHAGNSLSPYVVLGDTTGRLYLFNHRGDLLHEHDTGSASAVTCVTGYYARRNESVLVTGHADGEVRMHGTHETHGSGLEEVVVHSAHLKHVLPAGAGRLAAAGVAATGPTSGVDAAAPGPSDAQPDAAASLPGSLADPPPMAPPIVLLQHFKTSGRDGRRPHAVSVDRAGRMRVQRESGAVRSDFRTNQADPVAAQIAGNMIIILAASGFTATSTALLDRRGPKAGTCRGLNGSTLVAAAFDASRAHRGFGFSSAGDLLALTVPHEARSALCKVVRSQPVSLPPGPVRLASLGTYLVLSHQHGLAIFNVSNVLKHNMLPVLSEDFDSIGEVLGPSVAGAWGDAASAAGYAVPLLGTTGRSQRLAMTLGGGGLAAFWQSHLPGSAAPPVASKNWSQPLFIVAMLVAVGWQMYRKASGGGENIRGNDAFATTFRDSLRAASQSPFPGSGGPSSLRSSRYEQGGTGNGRLSRLERRLGSPAYS